MTNLTDHLDAVGRLPSPTERRALRERVGLSQRHVAEQLGVTGAIVSMWERGRTPSPRHLAEYVRLLDQFREAQP